MSIARFYEADEDLTADLPSGLTTADRASGAAEPTLVMEPPPAVVAPSPSPTVASEPPHVRPEPVYIPRAAERSEPIRPRAPMTSATKQSFAEFTKETILCNRYVLEDPVGSGGTSVVFRARDLHREKDGAAEPRIALKLLRPELRARPYAVERLKREFRLARALTHPHVVRVFDLDSHNGHWFMTMELLEGKTLASTLAGSSSSVQLAFTARRAGDILRACGEALAFAHDHGVIHGDFKPGNVFLPVSGHLRVLDFGAAISAEPTLEPHAPAATACYGSPEVLSGLRPDRRDDVFSFACVAYELLGGVHPFERRSALQARSSKYEPARLWNVNDRQWFALEAALALNRDERPGNMRALLGELFPAAIADRVDIPERIDIAEPGVSIARGLSPASTPAMYLPESPFEPAVRGPFLAATMLVALVLGAVAVYFQLNEHPRWPDELRASSGQMLTNFRSGLKERLQNVRPTAPAPPPETSPPRPLAKQTAAAPVPQPAPRAGKTEPTVEPANVQTASPSVSERTMLPAQRAAATESTPAPRAARPAPPPTFISFATDSITVDEGANSAVLTLSRKDNLDDRTYVHWRAMPGTARPGEDFIVGASGIALFADNQTMRSIYIPLLRDAIAEPQEEFFVELYDPAPGAQIWPTARARIIVRDDD